MIELLAAGLGMVALAACVIAFTYRRSFHDAIAVATQAERELNAERKVNKALDNRVNTLRGDNEALVAEREDLKRQLGRIEAERRAAQPKRGEGGKFVAKPKAAKKPKPVACG